jgi:hypothetical protein
MGMVVVMVEMGIAMRMTHIQVDRCMRWLVTILVVVVVVVVYYAGLISEKRLPVPASSFTCYTVKYAMPENGAWASTCRRVA